MTISSFNIGKEFVGSKTLLKISQIDFSRVDIMLLEKGVGDAWKKRQCPARMTNCSLKRSLKAVPTRTQNTLDPESSVMDDKSS